jgi:3-deoxy-manno-octulosonate cytidylyltransferase (CMP-KDO synthetase)
MYNNMNFIACIPARYGSSRLCGKPLLEINGKPIIQQVYERVKMVDLLSDVIVLTDDERIANVIRNINGNVSIINDYCLNGTDRICHYLNTFDYSNTVVVNVQGDEPFIEPENIKLAIENYKKRKLIDEKMVCSTLHYNTKDEKLIRSKSKGKMVLDLDGNILYCSRNIIPSSKNNDIVLDQNNNIIDYNIHIGVFVFDSHYLMNTYRNNNTPLQLTEDIEWMKIMEQGFHINSVLTLDHEIGVDTINDFNYLIDKYTYSINNIKNIYIILIENSDEYSSHYLKKKLLNNLSSKKCNITNEIIKSKTSIYLFIKQKYDIDQFFKLKKNNNYLIYEPLDKEWDQYVNINTYYKKNIEYYNLFNEIICNSKFMMKTFRKVGFKNKLVVNYHEYDEKYKSTEIIKEEIIYTGIITKCSFTKENFKKYSIIHENDFSKIDKDISIHIDYLLENNLYYILHTSTKLSTSLYLNCIFICNTIPVYVELLGEDYEFYFKDDLSDLEDVIKRAKETLKNKEKYLEYIEKYKSVREKLSPRSILQNYRNILENVKY